MEGHKMRLLLILLLVIPLTAHASDRDIYLTGPIDVSVAVDTAKQITDLNAASHDPITLIISSPGGSVYAGLIIYDAMLLSPAPVKTICAGLCASMAAALLSSGKGRSAYPNATVMIHGVSLSQLSGKVPELQNQISEAARLELTLDRILSVNTGKSIDEIRALTSYDHYLTSNEALKLGLIDKIEWGK